MLGKSSKRGGLLEMYDDLEERMVPTLSEGDLSYIQLLGY